MKCWVCVGENVDSSCLKRSSVEIINTPNLTGMVMDVMDMKEFENETFDIVIDKGFYCSQIA